MNPQDLAATILDLVGGRAEAEVVVTAGNSALTRFANSFIHQNVAEEGSAVSLRLAVDGRVSSAQTTNTDADALARFVDATIEAAGHQPVDPEWPGLTSSAPIPDVDHFDAATAEATPSDRAARVKAFVDAGRGMLAAGYCETVGHEVAFANSAGQAAYGRYTTATIDGIHQTGTSAGSGHAASQRLADLDGAAVGALAAQRAADSADTYDIKPGEYEVVLAPECVASIAVFFAAYGFNAKSHAEGQSFVEVGTQQFDPAISIRDDALDPVAFGVGFDSEGTPRRTVDLVRNGVTMSLAHDRRTARAAGVESTGHGGPGSEVWGPFPASVFVESGDDDVAAMIAGIDRGLYIATFNYCRVLEPKSLVVTGLTRNGTFMIENGRITGAVTNLRFTQSFVAALGEGRVRGVGNDARHADSEFGAGIIHAPSLHLAGWNFTGGAEG
jgi:predicted Zn-dependent protease